MLTVLVIAAHSDDEALGAGGTIARHTAAGDKVHLLFMADGIASRGGDAATRNQPAFETAKILGAELPVFLNLPDNKMDSLPLLDIVQVLEPHIQRIAPDIIYTHHGGDLNIDHRLTHQAVMTACRPLPGSSIKQIYTFEVLSASEWANPTMSAPFIPNHFVNISTTLERKLRALQAYHEEMRPFPHSRSLETVRALATLRGANVGVEAAEAFMVMRSLN